MSGIASDQFQIQLLSRSVAYVGRDVLCDALDVGGQPQCSPQSQALRLNWICFSKRCRRLETSPR